MLTVLPKFWQILNQKPVKLDLKTHKNQILTNLHLKKKQKIDFKLTKM